MAIEEIELNTAVAELLSNVDIQSGSTPEVTLPAVFDQDETTQVNRELVTQIYTTYKSEFIAATTFEQFKNVIDKVILDKSLALSDSVLVAKIGNLLRSIEGLPPL